MQKFVVYDDNEDIIYQSDADHALLYERKDGEGATMYSMGIDSMDIVAMLASIERNDGSAVVNKALGLFTAFHDEILKREQENIHDD